MGRKPAKSINKKPPSSVGKLKENIEKYLLIKNPPNSLSKLKRKNRIMKVIVLIN